MLTIVRNYVGYRAGLPSWLHRFLRGSPGRRKLISLLAVVTLVATSVLAGTVAMTWGSAQVDVLANGSFEQGFTSIPGCGVVGAHWGCFTNGGLASYGFYDDQWERVVFDGKHSQLIEINTKDFPAADPDRYAGIYQTVRVVPNGTYKLSLKGIIRTTEMEGDPWRYRVQVGWTKGPKADWTQVMNWEDVGWNTYYPRTEPGAFSDFQTVLRPEAEVITVYIRVWKKWGVAFQELDVNLDAISLVGPAPGMPKPQKPSMGTGGPVKPMGQAGPMDMPMRPEPGVCAGPELIYNGNFERGFNRVALGDVGRGWGAFTNGGAANYGFYDEQWERVIADGQHGQLIEINTKGLYPTDPDRYAGIYQHIGGLKKGMVYELSLRGLLRGEGNEEDPYRFAAQWGINPGKNINWQDVKQWEEMDLGPIYARTEPGALGSYTARFVAPADHIVLFIRGWKKWAISQVEMDFNLDAISLRACGGQGGPMADPKPGKDPWPGQGNQCVYVVKPGDTLAAIAAALDVPVQALIKANAIANPNLIFVGQKLQIPGCTMGADAMGPAMDGPGMKPDGAMMGMDGPPMKSDGPMMGMDGPSGPDHPDRRYGGPSMADGPAGMQDPMERRGAVYTVKAGDSLTAIAARLDVDVYALARANGIQDINLIYVGQQLMVP